MHCGLKPSLQAGPKSEPITTPDDTGKGKSVLWPLSASKAAFTLLSFTASLAGCQRVSQKLHYDM